MTNCKSNSTLITENGKETNGTLVNPIVTREELDRFKEIVFKDYGIQLSDEQALEQATALIVLFETLVTKRIASKKREADNI